MARKNSDAPGEFSKMEQAVLDYLFAHPDSAIATMGLMKVLKPEQDTEEQQRQAYTETEHAIEALIAGGLVKGKRHEGLGDVYFDELFLTPKGEVEAIKRRHEGTKLIIDVPRPDRK
jgi:hypothetical protein